MKPVHAIALLLSSGLLTASLSMNSVANPAFGRLLTSPAERNSIEKPKPTILQTSAGNTIIEPSKTTAATDRIQLSGFMSRSDGRKMVWINGKGFFDNQQLPEGLTVGPPDLNSLAVPMSILSGNKRLQMQLKPGQVWQPIGGVADEFITPKTTDLSP